MTKQKKLLEAEEYDLPIDTLLSFLRVPHKIYRDIYISIMERRLSSTPLVHCDASIAFLAREVGAEPNLMAEKIQSMIRMKWIEYEEVGKRDTNQIYVISPIWRYKAGINKVKFAIALQNYTDAIEDDKEHKMNTEEVYDLMNSVCSHTQEKIDKALCERARWEECRTCSNRKKEVQP